MGVMKAKKSVSGGTRSDLSRTIQQTVEAKQQQASQIHRAYVARETSVRTKDSAILSWSGLGLEADSRRSTTDCTAELMLKPISLKRAASTQQEDKQPDIQPVRVCIIKN